MRQKSKIVNKVVAGFLLLFVAMAIALLSINYSLKKHAGLVNKIDDPNAFIQTWDNALKALEQSGAAMNRYSTTGDSSDLVLFEEQRLRVNAGIDTLYKISASKPERKHFVDTLASLVDKRMILYTNRAYTVVENKNMESFDNAIRRFADKEITHAKAEPAQVAKDNNAPVTQNKNRNNFWQRLFSRKYKKENTEQRRLDSIAKTKGKVDQMISQLRKTEQLVKEKNIKNMLSLMADEQDLDTQIYNLTRAMEHQEIKGTRDQVKATSRDVESSTFNIMIALAIAAIIFIVFVTVLIQRDVKRDILIQKELETARKNAEALAKARQDFAASMSHEIRTPLNALVGFSEQLAKTELADEQEKMVNALARSSSHLLNVINPVLDYGKLIAGKAELSLSVFDLDDVMTDTKLLFEQQAEHKHIQLNVHYGNKGNHVVEGDVVKLKQILFNLVSNAIKFTLQGHVSVSYNIATDNEGKKLYRFVVEDTGIGIPADKINTIFDEFTQADTSVTREYGGTGLGLNIVKRLVEMQNGNVRAESTPGKGSRFTFEIPYKPSEVTKEVEQKQHFPDDALKGKTVVVCDDEEMNRMLLEHILVKYGATVIEASGAKPMFDYIYQNPVDFILLDIHMPGISGFDALKEIRAHSDKKIAELPVFVITGDVREEKREKIIQAGTNGFLAKPFVEAQLLQLVLSSTR